ncbi:MAG: TonB-dependent receptor, partial [Flavobacteriales bacterium]|nr:TonB-dependent receptor [Flavobacteriales bacterium]
SINNELSHTLNRSAVLVRYQLGDIFETNSAAFAQVNFDVGRFRINPAIRVDHFSFEYNDELVTTYKTLSDDGVMYSPKLNILFNYSPAMQWYIKAGRGFHSNDTRVVVRNSARATLPAAYGSDLGFIWKPYKNMVLNMAAWYLYLDQEFVYVGDAGVVEPSGRTQRQGIDLSARVQATDWLYFNLDANYTIARSLDDSEGENYIPLAPDLTVVGSVRVQHKSGMFGSVNVRYLDGRPANEDNSIKAEGYTVLDANIGYAWKRITLNVQVLNALDTEWNETQFATESRLDGEAESVEEIHFTPGTPRFVKAGIIFEF